MELGRVKIADLNDDTTYQRGPKSKIGYIASHWSDDKCGAILVGRRADKSLWVVDGYQRKEAARIAGKTIINAVIFSSKGPKHEADIYEAVNNERVGLSPIEKFRGRITAEEPVALAILEKVQDAGFEIQYKYGSTFKSVWPRINCVRHIEYCYNAGILERMLRIVKLSWNGQDEALKECFLLGLAHFLIIYGDEVNDQIFISKFKRKPNRSAVKLIMRAASKQVNKSNTGYRLALAVVFLEVYNNRSAKKLSADKLIVKSKQ